MDALALLCTLYAEGPSTLQRLRSGGCDSLSSLLETDREGLQARLGWDERLSERFLREAWILAERLDVDWSDEQDIDVSPQPEAPTSKRESSSAVKEDSGTTRREKLLSRWRDLDRDEPPRDPEMNPAHLHESDSPIPVDPAVSKPAVSKPAVSKPAVAGLRDPVLDSVRDARTLEQGLLALGLSAPQLTRLKAKGIESRAAFIDAETLELASLLGVPYTRAQRQQLLAKRVELEQIQPAPSSKEELVPPSTAVPSAASDHSAQRLDAAGPFA